MMNKVLFTMLVAILGMANMAANAGTIKGTVVSGQSNEPIAGATIIIYKSVDSAIEKILVSNDSGAFSIDEAAAGKYFMEVSFVGFQNFSSDVFDLKDDGVFDIGIIRMQRETGTLEGVVVTAKRPVIERKIDKLVFNVESSLTAAGSSALDLLEKAPGVEVDKDGNISMRGKSGVTVLIDDRPAYLSGTELANYLRNLPASSLDQLEIMTNPSAKYDASGNSGIINIKTKKIRQYGFNGNANASGMFAETGRASASLSLNYRKGRINTFGTYNYFRGNFINNNYIIRKFKDPGTNKVNSIFDQVSRNQSQNNSHQLKVGVDYYAGDKTIAGIVVQGNISDPRFVADNRSDLLGADFKVDSFLIARTQIRSNSSSFSLNGNLRHTFDSAGKKMTADLDYIVYDEVPEMTSITNYFLPDGSVQKVQSALKANTPSRINIYSGKVDFVLPLKGGHKLETGIKASRVETDNNAIYKMRDGKDYQMDYGKSNHFLYDEDILAAYASWSAQVKKWGFQAGLRAEQTNSTGRQLGNILVPDSSFSKSYLNLFPTAYVSFNASEKNSFGLNYGKRIQRPNYNDMNPFMYFLDEYTYEAGNVYLQPQITDRVELSHNYSRFLHSSVAFSHTKNVISEVLRQNTAKKIIYQTKDNIAASNSLVFATGANFKTGKKLTTNIDGSLAYNTFKGKLESGYLDTRGWGLMAKLSEQANLGKGWTTELAGFYRSAQIDGQIYSRGMWRMDASLQKSVLKNKGKINVFMRDIFNTQNFQGTIKSGDIDLMVKNQRISRTFGVSFNYRFGKPIKNLKQHNSGSAADEQSRVNTN